MQALIAVPITIFLFIYPFFLMAIGWWGVAEHWGSLAAFLVMVPATVLQIFPVISLAAFFGIKDVLGLHWAVALLCVAPGLIFMVPLVAALAWDKVTQVFRR